MNKINQKTLKDKIEIDGIGLHNGIKVNLNIKPAKVNSHSFLRELILKITISFMLTLKT